MLFLTRLVPYLLIERTSGKKKLFPASKEQNELVRRKWAPFIYNHTLHTNCVLSINKGQRKLIIPLRVYMYKI